MEEIDPVFEAVRNRENAECSLASAPCVLRDAPCRALLSMRDVVDGMKKFFILRKAALRDAACGGSHRVGRLEGRTVLVRHMSIS
jgi:hypothetical protein